MTSIAETNAGSYDKHAQSWEDALETNVGHKYLEKPAMETELSPNLEGQTVLSIGVGSGGELKEILKRNPKRLVGIDISEKLLELATRKYPEVELKKMNMMDMSFPGESFDYIYSSLTFHYAHDWDLLLKEVSRVLKRGGELLFSTHDPLYWSRKQETGKTYTNERGITMKEYRDTLPGGVEIIYYNHPNRESIKEGLEHAGFRVQSFFNPPVVELKNKKSLDSDEIEKHKKLKERNDDRPLFLVIKAVKL